MNMNASRSADSRRWLRSWSCFNRIRLSLKTVHGEGTKLGCQGIRGAEGGTIVEMALVCSVLLAMLFGIFEMSIALYTYNFISDAAREGTRYAIVRGSSCTVLTNCNATSAQIQAYLRAIPYPAINPNKLSATTTWLSATLSGSPATMTWTTCASQCNAPGNAVQVNVTYAFPLAIPFWKITTLTMYSTSQVVIAN
jgi:Flp pilus assembly protein TadG